MSTTAKERFDRMMERCEIGFKKIGESLWHNLGYLLRAIGGVLLVSLIVVGLLKICLWLAFSDKEGCALAMFIPVIEKSIWPILIVTLTFYFRERVEMILGSVSGILNRSCLPYSVPSTGAFENLTAQKDLAGNTDNDKLGETEDEHKKKVEHILRRIEEEYGSIVSSRVPVLNSRWLADGCFMFAGRKCYVAVLPQKLLSRVPIVIDRMESCDVGPERRSCEWMLMICVYGGKDRDLKEVRSRLSGKSNVAIRMFGQEESNG